CARCSLPFSLFFLLTRRPPRSTLFPTRRSSDLAGHGPRARAVFRRVGEPLLRPLERAGTGLPGQPGLPPRQGFRPGDRRPGDRRSEEHTSELQSRENLVCRLLLEKKKKRK